MPRHPLLGNPISFVYGAGKWYRHSVQSYACWKFALGTGNEVDVHHLLPRSLLDYGPRWAAALVDFVPSVPLSTVEHRSTTHRELNAYLSAANLWQRPLSKSDLKRAIEATARFYEVPGLRHFGAAVMEFHERVFRLASPGV